MISVMGFIVGMYILTKMADLIIRCERDWNRGFTLFLAGATIHVTLGAMFYFFLGPTPFSEALK